MFLLGEGYMRSTYRSCDEFQRGPAKTILNIVNATFSQKKSKKIENSMRHSLFHDPNMKGLPVDVSHLFE